MNTILQQPLEVDKEVQIKPLIKYYNLFYKMQRISLEESDTCVETRQETKRIWKKIIHFFEKEANWESWMHFLDLMMQKYFRIRVAILEDAQIVAKLVLQIWK